MAGLTLLAAFVARERRVLRQRLHDVVKTQPETPTVMVKRDRKKQRENEKHDEHALVLRAQNDQTKEANQQDRELRRHYVCEDSADEKPVFALEQRHAGRAMVPDFEGVRDDLRLTTHRTEQSHTTTQHPFDLL